MQERTRDKAESGERRQGRVRETVWRRGRFVEGRKLSTAIDKRALRR